MHTVKLHAQGQEFLPLSEAADRTAIAQDHAALFPARLALARLAHGAGLPHLHEAAGSHAPLRAAWLAQAQRNFQAWLDNGGFTQHDAAPSEEYSDAQPPALA